MQKIPSIQLKGMNPKKLIGFLFYSLCVLYEEILLRLVKGNFGFNMRYVVYIVLSSFFVGTILYILSAQLDKGKNKIRKIFVFLPCLLFTICALVQQSFGVYMTLESILSGAQDAMGGFGGNFISAIVGNLLPILLFFLPFLLSVFITGKKIPFLYCENPKKKILLCLLAIVLALVEGLSIRFDSKSLNAASKDYNYNVAVQTFGLNTSIFIEETQRFSTHSSLEVVEEKTEAPTTQYNVLEYDFASLADSTSNSKIKNLDLYLSQLTGSNQNEYTGVLKGKNLIFITAEAFSYGLIDPEITPTLYKLATEGISFTNYYQPWWGGSTTSGEYSILTGLIPTDGINSMKDTIGHDLFPTLGNMLMKEGYFSRAYHDNDYTYYDRNLTHENFGYEKFIGMGNGMEEGVSFNWPCSDDEMVTWSMPQYMDEEPFHVYYMSVSGHSNYDLYYDAMAVKHYDTLLETFPSFAQHSERIRCYIAGNYEIELALTHLIEGLKEKGIEEDTVICLTADHYPYGLQKSATWDNTVNYLDELYGKEVDMDDQPTRDKNTLIIYTPSLEDQNIEVSSPTSSIDILPTLANLFGLSFDSRLYAGRDVFSTLTPLVVWSDHSWMSDKGYYNATDNSFTSHAENVEEGYIEKMQQIVRNKFTLSETILSEDYYRHLEEK